MKTDKKKKSYYIAEVVGDTEPVPAPKRAYNRKPKVEQESVEKYNPSRNPMADELELAYVSLNRNQKDFYDIHLRYNKNITLLFISTTLNVALMVACALSMLGVK